VDSFNSSIVYNHPLGNLRIKETTALKPMRPMPQSLQIFINV